MHSHLIPGIDDGAKNIEASISLIRELSNLGFQKIITTPHIMSEYYPNTPKIIQAGLSNLKTALSKTDIKIEITAAAEYYIDDHFEKLIQSNASLMSFSDNFILIEFSTLSPPANALDIIFQLKTRGYQPILAHPERYVYYANQFEKFEKIKSLGCNFQVNLMSLTGYYGSQQKKLAIQLLKAEMVDYLGTDLHRASQLKELNNLDKGILRLLKKMKFKNIDL